MVKLEILFWLLFYRQSRYLDVAHRSGWGWMCNLPLGPTGTIPAQAEHCPTLSCLASPPVGRGGKVHSPLHPVVWSLKKKNKNAEMYTHLKNGIISWMNFHKEEMWGHFKNFLISLHVVIKMYPTLFLC